MELECLFLEKVIFTGDMIGTFMAWLDHTEAGGSTAFCQPGYEGVISPVRGKIFLLFSLFEWTTSWRK